MKSNWLKRGASVVLATIMLTGTLAACSQDNNADSDEKRLLRIGVTYGSANQTEWLRQQYTDLYQFTHPNIEIEFVPAIDWSQRQYETYDPENPQKEPDPVEEMTKLIEGSNPPDLVIVGYNELKPLIETNMLASLEPYISEDEFDISGFVPTVIEGLRAASGTNELYALAPTFTSTALIYNKNIFNELGVEYPTDGMTWDEVFDLAKRISAASPEGENHKAGFAFSQWSYADNIFYDMNMYTAALELRMYDDELENMLVDSQSWRDVWNRMIELKEQNVFPSPPDYSKEPMVNSRFMGNSFLSNQLAMMPIYYGSLYEIVDANANADKMEEFEPIDWDVVTMPVHPENPVGANVSMDPIMAITANAQNPDDAWDLIQFMNGEDWAKLKSKSSSNIVARKDYIEPIGGIEFNIEAFYTLPPGPNPYNDELNRKYPNLWSIQNIGQQKFMEVMNGDKDVDTALKEWAAEGSKMLQQIRENPNGPLDPIDVMPMEKF